LAYSFTSLRQRPNDEVCLDLGLHSNRALAIGAGTDVGGRGLPGRSGFQHKRTNPCVAPHDALFWSRRIGTLLGYANTIVFLASDRACYINSARVPVDDSAPVG
jgi:hypothetical protein